MATKIYNDGTQILCINTVDNSKAACLNIYTFAYREYAPNTYLLSDAAGTGIKVKLEEVCDEDGNGFTTEDALIGYFDELSRSVGNLGTNVRLDNIELSNTGSHLKMVNLNTGEQSFMVQQRVDPILGTTSVYYTEHTSEVQHETSSNAYQFLDIDTGKGTVNAQGRYALAIDIQSLQNTFVHEYRSKLNTDLENLNIKIFNVTQSPPDDNSYRPLLGVEFTLGWYISRKPYWVLNKQSTIDTKGGQNLLAGDVSFPFEEGFSLNSGDYYRFVISADNDFEFQGYEEVPNPFGGTHFVPYIERSFTGEAEIKVKTEGAKVHTTAIDFYREGTNTAIIVSDGESFNVNTIKAVEDNGTIKIISVDDNANITYYKEINHELVTIAGGATATTVTGVVNALNALFAVQPLDLGGDYVSTLPTLEGVAITANFAEGQDPIGDSVYAVASDTSQHGARVWSDETIDAPGEFYEVKVTGKGQFMIGLYSVADGDLAEIINNSGTGHSGYKWANAFYNYGSYIAPWTTYGSNSGLSYGPGWNGATTSQMRYNTIVQDNLADANPANPVLFKVGINAQGYIAVYYFDEGRSNDYIMTARSTYTLPDGQYGLMVKLVNGDVQLVEIPKRTAVDPVAPILTYHYIESPDGVFHYPLFTTEEEANYYDSQNGGVGSSHTHVYVDDTTGTTWYMPDNGSTMNGNSAPTNTSEVTYNVVATEDDSLHVPPAFSDQTITVNEGSALNLQLHPAGATFTTTIGSIPEFTLVNGYLQGTAPQVSGDNVTNPSDTTTVTVYRTNAYGTSQGTLTIIINNLNPPVTTAISGFTWQNTSTSLVDADTLDAGSVVAIDDTIEDGYRLIIPKTWIETNVLPHLNESLDQIIIGVGKSTPPSYANLDINSFDAHIKLEWTGSNSHISSIGHSGSNVSNVSINSLTDAYYNYAFEVVGTNVNIIRSTDINKLNNEPSVQDNGAFISSTTKTNILAPVTILIGARNTQCDLSTTGLSEITIPAPATTTTPFTKAVDFSGGAEYLIKANSSYLYTPMAMGNANTTIAAPTAGQTVTSGHPWACSVVFKIDGHSSNQHIWNYGEGAGSTDDNIYLRLDSNRGLYFGWGRDGARNELYFGALNTTTWYGCYIGFNGTRLSGANATPANLADVFEVRLFSDATAWQLSSAPDSSTSTMWGLAQSTTGGRMDRQFTGSFTVGGRGGNRNFHGKVASMMVTTLRCGVAMPTTTEIELMVKNPIKWVEDYKLGNPYRRPSVTTDTNNFALNSLDSSYATQLYLMGDVSTDSYSNGIRSYIYPTEQNRSKMQFNSMVSNDIETININGLS